MKNSQALVATFVLLGGLMGCSGATDGSVEVPEGGASDTDPQNDSVVDTGADTDEPADTSPSDALPSDALPTDATDAVGPADAGFVPVRFVAIGDTGKGNTTQTDIGKAVAAKCAKDGCDFVQLLGDNIYDSGVSSVTDPQWTTKFETPYGGVALPFYAVLGNHDYGGNGAGTEFGKGQFQVDYTAKSTKWKMPAKYYPRTVPGVSFFGLDTNMMMFSMATEQKKDVAAWVAAAKTPWKFAFGHHPILSNGPHGNAGTYEGIPFIPITSGQGVKDFMDAEICGKVDFYVCGHDHSRQYIQTTCKGTQLVISGAGAATTDLKGKNPTWFQAATPGFVWFEITAKSVRIEFLDATGKVEFTRTVTK
ncbi:MAG: metallophosphoesterase [Myxococcales bacterium]|nr:metallophosphoesterase [Myxococcales bacterium]